jgi:3-dehydroquinate synthase
MKIINVKGEHRYPVKIGVNWTHEVKAISSIHNKVLIIAPKSIVSKYKLKESLGVKLFITPEGENQKNIDVLDKVWSKCAAEGIARADSIIGIGGGATTDLAGFAASSWLRGVSWYAIPTSLAGMVDAAVGGKTGINARSGKNLIGSFYSPTEVLIDLAFLNTLPKRDLSAGMAEVLKCGFIADYKILNLAQDDDLDYQQLITRAIKVKADVVSKDFKESKLREILNYGHTLGHAIEKNSGYKLRHGEAVSI